MILTIQFIELPKLHKNVQLFTVKIVQGLPVILNFEYYNVVTG